MFRTAAFTTRLLPFMRAMWIFAMCLGELTLT